MKVAVMLWARAMFLMMYLYNASVSPIRVSAPKRRLVTDRFKLYGFTAALTFFFHISMG